MVHLFLKKKNSFRASSRSNWPENKRTKKKREKYRKEKKNTKINKEKNVKRNRSTEQDPYWKLNKWGRPCHTEQKDLLLAFPKIWCLWVFFSTLWKKRFSKNRYVSMGMTKRWGMIVTTNLICCDQCKNQSVVCWFNTNSTLRRMLYRR